MNEIVNKFLLAGDKFMPEMHLKQPGFTYSACGPFTKNKERIQKSKETGDISYIYKNELDKACFQHDMVYGDFKDIKRRTASDKILIDKAFNIAKILNITDIKEVLLPWFIGFLIKNLKGLGLLIIKKIWNYLRNFISQLLKNLKKGKFILHLDIIYRVLI